MRLPIVEREWLDRAQKIEFSFEGRRYEGYAGDSVSSALWANGVRVLGRSFKYHRPRGLLSLANHDVNALFQQGGEPNIRGDARLLEAGMNLTVVNTFGGGVDHDNGRFLGLISRFLPVGFYYKAFHTRAFFPLWEKVFRLTTGLGKVDFATPRKRTAKAYDFCDVLVVGGGPSGLAAASAAAKAGARVAIVEENARLGGSGVYQLGADDGRAARLDTLLDKVGTADNVRVITNHYAAGYYKDHWLPLVAQTPEAPLTKMRARAVIVASGAFEQPAVFHANDLPGVMLASAAQRLFYRYGVRALENPLVLTANADGYRVALDMAKSGARVAGVVDLRATHAARDLEDAVRARNIPVHAASIVAEAVPGSDGKSVVAARIGAFADGRADFGTLREIPCDGILMSVGWAGAANLLYQAETKMRYDDALEQFVPETLPEGVFACGKVNGVHALAAKIQDGERAGNAAAAYLGFEAGEVEVPPAEIEPPSHPWPMAEHPCGKNFVDFDEDVQFKDIANAIQEGFDNIELLKRYSTSGMGPSQGKHSNMNALRILARLTGQTPGTVGTTTARPMYHPVSMAALAGRGFSPERRTPLHDRHAALSAAWMSAGAWQRPAWYRKEGQTARESIHAETMAVRNGVGLIDVGTLGKLEIRGKDAAEFLERVYVSRYAGLKTGMSRYAVMCDETGVVIDDGVVARLAEDHFYFTTTTSGAAGVYAELSRWNILWDLDVTLVNHTGAYAAVNLAGPKSRAVLTRLTDLDLSDTAFPYLTARVGEVAGIPARLLRVGFVGEWGYEIHAPAHYAAALWDALFAEGKEEGICPFGVEAQRLLRLEKGHVIIGQDSDGLTTPLELNLDWAVKMDKPFFVGQRSLAVIGKKPARQRLSGLVFPTLQGETENAPKECNLVIEDGEIAGRITSVAYSPTLCRHIALAFVPPARTKPGERLSVRLGNGDMLAAEVVPTPFYDPENRRQKDPA
ncbi:MAG: (2Fe-2S)-binding protein [Zoogloeaceae bacterium]|jgi:sarcosine oxidase subunit alpha|nr:(2Fe-2S)-binding protein [Zoogloeaceae bacterium]